MIWHSSEVSDVLNELSVDSNNGLANGVADERLNIYGKNTLRNIEAPSFFKIFLNQIKNGWVISLVVIAIISFIVFLIYDKSSFYSPLLIIAIVLINSLISAYNLFSGEKVLNSLKGITNPDATVLRDGIIKSVPSNELIPGDIIIINEGDYISADARIIECSEFRTNEAIITDDTIPVEKRANEVLDDITTVENRINMVFSGTSAVHGTAKAVVVATGLDTELGKSSAIMQQTGEETIPLQRLLKDSGKIINAIIVAFCVLVFIIGVIQNFNSATFATMTVGNLINAMALAVAAIPEGLPAIATIVVGLGIERIIRNNVIIKNTAALETLGETSVLCVDKTGLLTKNTMYVEKVFDGKEIIDVNDNQDNSALATIIRFATIASTLENDTTEKAIENACIKYNSMSKIDVENAYPRMAVIPFDFERKTMTTINIINERPFAISKGAPEILVNKCKNCDVEKILKINDELASDALRIVCIAVKPLDEIPANPIAQDIETDMTFVGLIGLIDPPRSEVFQGVELCNKAGITPIMITGDNPTTAASIARRIGILKDGTEILCGTELAELSDEELSRNIEKYSVFARITPADKVRIVSAWQKIGKTVTITGDSIDDAEALSLADTGCAMGKVGTDIAKGSADIIVSNDRFLSIVAAIKESRGLFENIKKSVIYLLSCNFSEILLYVIGLIFFGMPPLAAVQLLWINLLTDCAPAFSLAMETAEEKVMHKKPLALKGRIFDKKTLLLIVSEAVFMCLISLISFILGVSNGSAVAMAMTFATLGLTQLFHCYNVKTDLTIFKANFKSNSFMNVSAILTAFIIFFLLLTPAGHLFGLATLTIGQLFISLLLAFSVVPFCEILKLVLNKKIK